MENKHFGNWKEVIEVSILNNGAGIKAEDLEPILINFIRDQNVKPIGSGLGLAICKQIIEHHKGKIWVKAHYKKG
jgi:signal transduction histidine kinase